MKPNGVARVVARTAGIAALLMSVGAMAQGWRPPAEAQRCPSKWGADDERGAANHMKPETVMRAAKLIRTGEVIELAHMLNAPASNSPARVWSMTTKRSNPPAGANQRGGNEEMVTTELGQIGTQFDAFPHQMIASKMYKIGRAHV